jgi:phosphatidylserine synthase
MVSTIRFRSFKTINFGWGPSYMPLLAFAALIVIISFEPRFTLVLLAYGYLFSPFIGLAATRLRSRRPEGRPEG